jgi:hypothetical protein
LPNASQYGIASSMLPLTLALSHRERVEYHAVTLFLIFHLLQMEGDSENFAVSPRTFRSLSHWERVGVRVSGTINEFSLIFTGPDFFK